MTHFTQTDLDKMGLKKNPDGTLSKPKTRLQPREIAKIPTGVDRVKYEMELASKGPSHIHSEEGFLPKKKPSVSVYFNGMDIQDVYAKCHAERTIFIPGNVPSLKNSKQLHKSRKTGKNFITSSEYCKRYVRTADIHYRLFKMEFEKMLQGKEKPYTIQFFFVRDDRAAFDYINICQMPLDLMQKHGWLHKDDNRHVIPDFSQEYGYDPKMPGVIIKVL